MSHISLSDHLYHPVYLGQNLDTSYDYTKSTSLMI